MKMTDTKRLLSFILSVVLVAAMALLFAGCNNKDDSGDTVTTAATGSVASDEGTTATPGEETPDVADVTAVGEGETTFLFTVTDKDGNETKYEVKTDKTTVGEALLDLGLIEGEDGQYGLYVKKVCGIVADYDVDQTYWAFYVNGEYAMSGVDTTNIEDGAAYAFKVEK